MSGHGRSAADADDQGLHRLASLLNDADRLTLLCGAGCAGAHDDVLALATLLKAPIVHALRGKEFIEYDNPHDVGLTGAHVKELIRPPKTMLAEAQSLGLFMLKTVMSGRATELIDLANVNLMR